MAFVAFAAVVAGSVGVLSACGGGRAAPNGGGSPGAGGPGGAPPPMPVQVIVAQAQTLPATLETVGTLEGLREVEVRGRVAGVVEAQQYTEGATVKAGAPLFRIERAPYQLAREAAQAQLAQAQARAEQAARESTRLASLLADKAISQREADDAATALKTSEAALMAARAQLREAELNLGYSQVTAPIGGLAQRAQVSVGSLVAPGGATLLTTIVQTHPIRVRFALSDAEVQALRRGGARSVVLLGADGQPTTSVGNLDFAGSVVDPRLGVVPMRAELPNADGTWLPGQTVRLRVTTGQQRAWRVPQAAVMSGDQGRFVWVIGPQNQATPKPVKTGEWLGKDWIIREGLADGDRVIIDNLMKIRPGAPVQVAPPPGAAAGASTPAAPAARAASAPAAPAASR